MLGGAGGRGMTLVVFVLVATGFGMGLEAGLEHKDPAEIRAAYDTALDGTEQEATAPFSQPIMAQVRAWIIPVFAATYIGTILGSTIQGVPAWAVFAPYVAVCVCGVAVIVWAPAMQLVRRVRWWVRT